MLRGTHYMVFDFLGDWYGLTSNHIRIEIKQFATYPVRGGYCINWESFRMRAHVDEQGRSILEVTPFTPFTQERKKWN